MRVVMVSDVFFPRVNGVSTAIRTYHDTLADHGVNVKLIAPSYGDDLPAEWITRVPGRKVPFDPEDRIVKWSAMQKAVAQAVEQGCDLIHVQTPFAAHYAGLAAAKKFGIPVIATYHTLFEEYLGHYMPIVPDDWMRKVARWFSRRQCNQLDGIIVPSSAMLERLQQYQVKTPIHVLPTGVSINPAPMDARESFRRKYSIGANRPVALFVGRVAHEKNIDFLLDAIDLARSSVPEVLLVIAGEGPALSHLKRAVSERGLQTHVMFIGYLDRTTELPACYAAADVFVFSSRTETQGLVLLEALASGLPAVALAEMGTKDILSCRRGALVPADNAFDFSLALTKVLSDAPLRQSLSEEARAYASEWSSIAMAERMTKLYRQILSSAINKRLDGYKLSPL